MERTIDVHGVLIESRLTSNGGRKLTRTQSSVKNASGDFVAVCRPQRLLKLRSNQSGS